MHHSVVNLIEPHSASSLAAVAVIAGMKPAILCSYCQRELHDAYARGGWYRGNEVSMTQVLSTGQTATHCGSSK
ncbi:hypothetical protein ACYCVF_35625 [Bradyrhizobium sp. 1.29L]